MESRKSLIETLKTKTVCEFNMCMDKDDNPVDCCWNPKRSVASGGEIYIPKESPRDQGVPVACSVTDPETGKLKDVVIHLPEHGELVSPYSTYTSEMACAKVNKATARPFMRPDYGIRKNPGFNKF